MLLKRGLNFFGVIRFQAIPDRGMRSHHSWHDPTSTLSSDPNFVLQCYRCQVGPLVTCKVIKTDYTSRSFHFRDFGTLLLTVVTKYVASVVEITILYSFAPDLDQIQSAVTVRGPIMRLTDIVR